MICPQTSLRLHLWGHSKTSKRITLKISLDDRQSKRNRKHRSCPCTCVSLFYIILLKTAYIIGQRDTSHSPLYIYTYKYTYTIKLITEEALTKLNDVAKSKDTMPEALLLYIYLVTISRGLAGSIPEGGNHTILRAATSKAAGFPLQTLGFLWLGWLLHSINLQGKVENSGNSVTLSGSRALRI